MKPLPYLTERGKKIFHEIERHCSDIQREDDIFCYEASMLANSFDMYAIAAEAINTPGASYKQKSKTGWDQTTADYAVLKQEYANIIKHAPKFGLNPKDWMNKAKEKTEDAQTKLTKLRKIGS